jgi:hypothetical protein
MPSKTSTYETLSEADLLATARDALRGKETDHYRLTILAKTEPSAAERLPVLEEQIADLRKEVAAKEKSVKAS